MKDPAIVDLSRNEPRRDYAGYEFVVEAVCEVQDMLNRHDGNRHITPVELLQGAVVVAVAKYGAMTPLLFKRWGIWCSGDFGDMVVKLIHAEVLIGDGEKWSDFLSVDLNDEMCGELERLWRSAGAILSPEAPSS